jgi:hypothetical protein
VNWPGRRERGRDRPALGGAISTTWARLAAGRVEEHRRAVKEPVGTVEVAGPNRELVRVDPVAHDDAPGAARRDAEALLVEPLDRETPALSVLRLHALEVTRELPDEVAAGRPHGERQLRHGAWALEDGLDVEQMRVRFGKREPIAHGAHNLARDQPRARELC